MISLGDEHYIRYATFQEARICDRGTTNFLTDNKEPIYIMVQNADGLQDHRGKMTNIVASLNYNSTVMSNTWTLNESEGFIVPNNCNQLYVSAVARLNPIETSPNIDLAQYDALYQSLPMPSSYDAITKRWDVFVRCELTLSLICVKK